MPSPACRNQTLVQQHESCRPRRPAPSPRVPRSRDGSSVRPRRDPRRTDGRCPARPLRGAASHEAEGRSGARGGGADRVGPPTGRRRWRLLRQIGDQLVPGLE